MLKKIAVALLLTLLAAIVAIIAFSPRNEMSNVTGSQAGQTQEQAADVSVNYALPIYTKRAALICPQSVALDPREGYGLKGAVDAHLSIFGHDDAIQKSGCEEWRDGIPISLSSEGQNQAKDWDAAKLCGMIQFDEGYIFSCSLRNATKEEAESAGLQHSEQGLSKALQDPSKVRLMECIGVNPWKEKPKGWTPPTNEECTALEQKLGIAPDTSQTSTASSSQPEDVRELIKVENGLNDKCRDGSSDAKETIEACDQRDLLDGKIKAKNWCWGHDGQASAVRIWEPCRKDFIAPVSTAAQSAP